MRSLRISRGEWFYRLALACLVGLALLTTACNRYRAYFGPATMKSYPPGQPGPDTQIVKIDPEQASRCQKPINSIAFSPDGKQLLTGSEDGFVQVWDRGTHKLVKTFRAGGGARFAGGPVKIAFPPDGQLAVSSWFHDGDDSLPMVWSIPDMRKIGPLAPPYGGGNDIQFSPDGKWIACCGSQWHEGPRMPSGSGPTHRSTVLVRVWDASTRELAKTLCEDQEGEVQNISFSLDSKLLLAAGKTCPWALKAWNVQTGLELCSVEKKASDRRAIFLQETKKVLFAYGFPTSTIASLDIQSNENEARVLRQAGLVYGMAESPKGNLALSIEGNPSSLGRSAIVVWSLLTGEEASIVGSGHIVSSARFSPEGTDVVGSVDGMLASWSIETGKMNAIYEE
jgi:WD40 repeat protein